MLKPQPRSSKIFPMTEDLPIMFSPGSNFHRVPEPCVRDRTLYPLLVALELVSRVVNDAEHRRG